MSTSDLNSKKAIEAQYLATADQFRRSFEVAPDPLEGGLLENINSTPMGRLLKMIGSLPDIRYEKVTSVRREIDRGKYNLRDNLDLALDLVLEELIIES